MKKMNRFCAMCFVFVLVVSMAACAKKDASMSTEDAMYAPAESYDMAVESPNQSNVTYSSNSVEEEQKPGAVAAAKASMISNSSAISLEESAVLQTQDKIIRNFFMDVETQEFDTLITTLNSEVNRLEGYIENSQISGRSLYDEEGARRASITARIPREHVDEFVNTVDVNANVVNRQESTKNVTLEYTDIESRKKALEIEQERLFVLLDKTDNLESIVTLESRLSEIRYELQNYQTQLLTFDNKVAYSTVTLNVSEVKKFTPTAKIKQTVGTRIKNGFGNTMYNISEGVKNFFVWFVVNLPYILIWGLVITLLVFAIIKIYRKNNADEPKSSKVLADTLKKDSNDNNISQ